MMVTPSIVTALWSDGPAPPRRLAAPALGSTSRTPKDCNSLISTSVGSICFIGGVPLNSLGVLLEECGSVHRRGWAIVEIEAQKFGPGVMPHRIHHAFALDDQPHIQIGQQDAFAL